MASSGATPAITWFTGAGPRSFALPEFDLFWQVCVEHDVLVPMHSSEIEGYLLKHPDVVQAAVIGVSDERMGQVGKAFVVIKDGAAVSEPDLIAWAKQRMAGSKLPRSIVFLDAPPLSANGKVMKDRLQ